MSSMIKACIFDLGGTIVDRYSVSPLFSLKRAFLKNNIKISDRVILKDMGMSKSEHIGKILCDNYVQRNWFNEYGKFPDPNDADMIYEDFKIEQNKESKIINILPETKRTFEYLKERDVKIGITTGFDKDNMDLILSRMEDEGLYVDGAVSSTCLLRSRPYPDMMNKLIKGHYAVIHLAALIGIPYSYVAIESYYETNVKGTMNILNSCKTNKTKRIFIKRALIKKEM